MNGTEQLGASFLSARCHSPKCTLRVQVQSTNSECKPKGAVKSQSKMRALPSDLSLVSRRRGFLRQPQPLVIQQRRTTCQKLGSITITPLVTTRRRHTISMRRQNTTRPRSAKKPRTTHTWLTDTVNRQFITQPRPQNFTRSSTTTGQHSLPRTIQRKKAPLRSGMKQQPRRGEEAD
jgi:hypothetical protein